MRTAAVLRVPEGRFPFTIRRIGFKIYKDSIDFRRAADTSVVGLGTGADLSLLNLEYAALRRCDLRLIPRRLTPPKNRPNGRTARNRSRHFCSQSTRSQSSPIQFANPHRTLRGDNAVRMPNSDGVAFANVLALLSAAGPAAAPAGRG